MKTVIPQDLDILGIIPQASARVDVNILIPLFWFGQYLGTSMFTLVYHKILLLHFDF